MREIAKQWMTPLRLPYRYFLRLRWKARVIFICISPRPDTYLSDPGSQFESFMDQQSSCLPCHWQSVEHFFSLYFFGQTINIFSQIGMIMLIGLVTKNGIDR